MMTLTIRRLPVLFLALSSVCFGQSPRELARTGFKSVVLLAMNDANGQPLCVGSGFFVADDVVATNAHVIEGAGSGSAKLVGQAQIFHVLGTIAIDRHADLALLKVAGTAPPLPLSHEPIPVVGDGVYVIGNPLGLEGTFSEGIVSGIRKMGTDSIIQMTAPISSGSSGGPVMDAQGEVVGVSVATFTHGQNLNLAVPVSYLEQMLETHPTAIMPFRSESPQASRIPSIIDGFGTRTEDGVVGSDFNTDGFGYSFSLSNKLPVAVTKVRVLVIFYDHDSKMLDFEPYIYDESIPAGLTKNIEIYSSTVSRSILFQVRGYKKLTGKAEVRVIGFNAGESRY